MRRPTTTGYNVINWEKFEEFWGKRWWLILFLFSLFSSPIFMVIYLIHGEARQFSWSLLISVTEKGV